VRGPSLDDLLAVLWGAGGLGVAIYFVVLGRENDNMGVSPVPLYGFAAVALVGFSVVAVRHARRGHEARAARAPGSVGARQRPRPTVSASRSGRPWRPAADAPRPAPRELSPSGRAALAHVVGVAERAGLFAPRTPAAADLVEAVADAGGPVTLDVVLAAPAEAGSWRPGFRAEDHLRALAFHDSHVEQLPETLEGQVADLDRLAGDALDVRLLAVDLADDDGGGAVRTRLRLAFSTAATEGVDEQALDYRGDPKDLSTVLHVAVARALRAATPQGPWLAWTWSDQGVWLAALRPAALEPLNRELDRALLEPWRWVDAEEPVAAGDLRRSR
jgi:hypothetical protein